MFERTTISATINYCRFILVNIGIQGKQLFFQHWLQFHILMLLAGQFLQVSYSYLSNLKDYKSKLKHSIFHKR